MLPRTASQIALTFGRQFVAGLLQLGQVLVIARSLGPEGVGAYALALFIPTVLSQLLNFGLASANIYLFASKQFQLSQVWSASRDLVLVTSTLGLFFGAAMVWLWSNQLFPGVPSRILLIALLGFPPSLLLVTILSLFQAKQDFQSFNAIVLIQPGLAFVSTCALWLLDAANLDAVVLASVAAHVCAVIAALFWLRRLTPLTARTYSRSDYLSVALRYGAKAYLSNILSFLNYRLDLFLVNFFVGPAGAGLYTVAVRLVEQLWMISQAVSTVLFPSLSAMTNDEARFRTTTEFMSRVVLWSTLVTSIFLATLAESLIDFLFGVNFVSAASTLMILLPGVVVFASARIIAHALAARGRVEINLSLTLAVVIINLSANLLLIPYFGVEGAAAATSVAYCFTYLAYLFLGREFAGLAPSACVIPTKHDLVLLHLHIKQKLF